MKDFTPEEKAELDRLADEVNRILTELRNAGVPIEEPNGNPVLMDMLFDDEGAPLEGRRYEFERRVMETWIAAANAAAPDLKVQAARMRLQREADIRASMPGMPGAKSPFGIVHEGRVTRRN